MFKFHQKTSDRVQNYRKLRYFNFTIVCLCSGVDVIGLAAVVTLSENIKDKFGVDYTTSTWALTAYAVTFAGFIALFGRVGDFVGNAKILTCGSFLLSIFSLLCAVVPNFGAFAAFRALQGLAGAAIVPTGYALVPHLFTKEESQRYFSILAGIFSTCFGLGFIFGGAFAASDIGYKGLFYFMFGIMLVLSTISFFTFMGVEMIEQSKDSNKNRWKRLWQLDFIGTTIFISGSILLVVGLTEGGEKWNQPKAYVVIPVSVILLIAFCIWNVFYDTIIMKSKNIISEKNYIYLKGVQVLIPIELVKSKNFIAMVIASFLFYLAFTSCFYLIVQYSELVEGNTPIIAAIKLIPFMLGLLLTNTIIAVKHELFHARLANIVGLFLMFCSSIIIIMLHLVHDELFWKLFLAVGFINGVGSALFFSFMLMLVVGNAPIHLRGIASGTVQTFGQFGNEVAFSIMASILGTVDKKPGETYPIIRLKDKFQNIAYFNLASSLIAFLTVLLFTRSTVSKSGHVSDDVGVEPSSKKEETSVQVYVVE